MNEDNPAFNLAALIQRDDFRLAGLSYNGILVAKAIAEAQGYKVMDDGNMQMRPGYHIDEDGQLVWESRLGS